MKNNKTILLHNITPEELREMIMVELKKEINTILINPNANKPDYYSCQQVAKMLGITTQTVYGYIKKGILPATRIQRKIQIKRIDLENVLEEVKSLKYRRD